MLHALLIAVVLAPMQSSAPNAPITPPATGDPAPRIESKPAPAKSAAFNTAPPVRLTTGLRFTEGPAVDPKGRIYFTDLGASRLLRLTSPALATAPDGTTAHEEVIASTRGCNGLAFTADHRLIACQGGDRGAGGALVEVDLETGTFRVIADAIALNGASVRFGRINDLAIDETGGIYFTDPSLGRQESPTRGILYRGPNGAVTLVDTSIAAPNGICLAPDGKRLYALSYKDPGVYACDVLAPGSLGAPQRIGSLRGADGEPGGRGDGLAVDPSGRLWCTNPDLSEVQVFAPSGELLHRIRFPEPPSNCCFSADGSTLFVTASTSVYGVRVGPESP